MTKEELKEIVNNNIEISKFMGYEYTQTENCGILSGNKFTKSPDGTVSYGHHCFKNYHNKWDDLMPVVEEIEKLMTTWKIPNYKLGYTDWMNKFRFAFWDIDCLYEYVVEFIKWYNETNNK